MYSMQMMHAIIILASFDGMQSHQESSDATIPLSLKTQNDHTTTRCWVEILGRREAVTSWGVDL